MKDHFRHIIHFATRAPSGHNTQPWKFHISGNSIFILPDFDRALPVVDADNHALFISLGCATENLCIAASHFGYEATVRIHDEDSIFIEAELNESARTTPHPLFDQIDKRQSTRNLYNGQPIPQEHLGILLQSARQPQVSCRIITGDEMQEIGALAKEACMLQFSNRDFVQELMSWIRFSKSAAQLQKDGLSSKVSGNPWVPSWFGKMFMRMAATPSGEAAKVERQIMSAAALAVFIGHGNHARTWIEIGRSFERFALTATSLNIHHAHVNMPCEEKSVRSRLAQQLDLLPDEHPLLLIRIGYSEKMPYSYRRAVADVMLDSEENT